MYIYIGWGKGGEGVLPSEGLEEAVVVTFNLEDLDGLVGGAGLCLGLAKRNAELGGGWGGTARRLP